jgi:hypothetical protein
MGVLASMGLKERQVDGTQPIVVNISPHVRELLELLGLNYILDLRSGASAPQHAPADGEVEFEPVETPEMSRLDRIVMMIEAHQQLIDVDRKNEVKFKGVLDSLKDSLNRTDGH